MNSGVHRHRSRGRGLILHVLCLAACCGCSSKKEPPTPTGSVRGTVTFEGAPLKEGEISFVSEETGGGATAQIDSSGRFEVETPLEVGVYRVAVCPPTLRATPGETGAKVPLQRMKQYPDIPEFYHSEWTSDLTATITTGENALRVNMKRQKPAVSKPDRANRKADGSRRQPGVEDGTRSEDDKRKRPVGDPSKKKNQ